MCNIYFLLANQYPVYFANDLDIRSFFRFVLNNLRNTFYSIYNLISLYMA